MFHCESAELNTKQRRKNDLKINLNDSVAEFLEKNNRGVRSESLCIPLCFEIARNQGTVQSFGYYTLLVT